MERTCDRRGLVDRHFQGRLTPTEEVGFRAHLPDCPICQARYQRQGLFAELSGARPGRVDRIALGLGLPPSGPTRQLTPIRVALPVLALAACLALLATRGLRGGAEPEFASRGRASLAATASLEVFRVPPSGAPVRAQGWVGAGDELAFAYRNPGGFRHLLVFGLDDRGELHWFHPAWTDPRQDPLAVPAQPGVGPHELGEAIRHELPGRLLRVVGIFTNQPLSVRETERRVRAGLLDGPEIMRVEVPLEIRR
jgi:hypothetical protein